LFGQHLNFVTKYAANTMLLLCNMLHYGIIYL